MSEPVVVINAPAVLLAALPSLVAPVVPVNVLEPTVVGVPDTVQVTVAPAATVAGTVGEHDVVSPGGRPLTAHDAVVALTAGAAALVQLNVPLYGTPILAVVGKPTRLMLISAAALRNVHVIVCPPPR